MITVMIRGLSPGKEQYRPSKLENRIEKIYLGREGTSSHSTRSMMTKRMKIFWIISCSRWLKTKRKGKN